MISIPNISDSDGAMFSFCIDCGRIYGFNKEDVKQAIDSYVNDEN